MLQQESKSTLNDQNTEVEPICWSCKYFERNMSGTRDKCWINFYSPRHLHLSDHYVSERMTANKTSCKYFESNLPKRDMLLSIIHSE